MSWAIKPKRLEPGDLVGIVAPASPPPHSDCIAQAVERLENSGFKVKLSRFARRRAGFLAGTDRERAGDLMAMFTTPRVRAILCLRGGYGTTRLLDRLDFGVILQNPKILCGFSDVTGLLIAVANRSRLITFHGPMLLSGWGLKGSNAYALSQWKKAVMHGNAAGSIRAGYRHGETIRVIRGGKATGPLVGGNLSLLCSLLGTAYQPSFRKKILILEDVNELPYRMDRYLTQLLNARLLQQAAGIAVGRCRGCEEPKPHRQSEYRQTLLDVLTDRLKPLGIPVVAGLPFGHVPENATLPLGVRARLDGDRGDLEILEAAVK